ncbi:MAG TPA: hypothetical protein VGB17_17285 [Pyrinomonadaceae bacterium]
MMTFPTFVAASCFDNGIGPKDHPAICVYGTDDKLASPERVVELKSPDESLPSLVVSPPAPLALKDKLINSAYRDVFRLLQEKNSCSNFYGGAAHSLEVLNKLVARLKKETLASKAGIEMSGETVNFSNHRTGSAYRLFKRAVVNANGPFYKQKIFPADAFVPGIGSYQPNSREGRALMLLHELAHLVKGPQGEWLIPDDGNDALRSQQNTIAIEDVCGAQLKGLKKAEEREQLAREVKE